MFNNRRVEEDLKRIRKANLPPEKLADEEAAEQQAQKKMEEFTLRDFLSVVLAIFSLILPYVAVFAGFLGIVYLVIRLMA